MNNQVVRNDDVGLSSEDIAALRENLEDQRRFRQEQLQQIAEASRARHERAHRHAPQRQQGEQGQQGQQMQHVQRGREDAAHDEQSASVTEVGVKLAASARMVLSDVEAALERMTLGQYGACSRCTRPISLARLTIVPQARYCARCHQVREARQ